MATVDEQLAEQEALLAAMDAQIGASVGGTIETKALAPAPQPEPAPEPEPLVVVSYKGFAEEVLERKHLTLEPEAEAPAEEDEEEPVDLDVDARLAAQARLLEELEQKAAADEDVVSLAQRLIDAGADPDAVANAVEAHVPRRAHDQGRSRQPVYRERFEGKHGDPDRPGYALLHPNSPTLAHRAEHAATFVGHSHVNVGGVNVPVIRPDQARGDSRAVSAGEFARLAAAGRDKLAARQKNASPPHGLDQRWKAIKQVAYTLAQRSWGGVTVDAHTGRAVPDGADLYALTIKGPGMDTVSVPEGASRADFDRAMDTARQRFSSVLEREGSHLGVFHDDLLHRIDIDPILVVDNLRDVEAIGAWTHAIGGAYHFRSGDGFFPPHVGSDEGRRRLVDAGQLREDDLAGVKSVASGGRLATLAAAIRDAAGGDPTDDDYDDLWLAYAALAVEKGTAVTAADVHDAWVAWRRRTDPDHPSLRDFEQLDVEVQEKDEPYVQAIRAAIGSTVVEAKWFGHVRTPEGSRHFRLPVGSPIAGGAGAPSAPAEPAAIRYGAEAASATAAHMSEDDLFRNAVRAVPAEFAHDPDVFRRHALAALDGSGADDRTKKRVRARLEAQLEQMGSKGLFGMEAKHGHKEDPDYRFLHPPKPGMKWASPEERAAVRPPIPPAWTDVQVAEDPNARLQVLGKDAKGRPQYRYSAEHTEAAAARKFARVKKLAAQVDKLDSALKDDYRDPAAGAVILIRRLGMRPGSEADTGAERKAHGATNLRVRHVTVTDGKARFRFEAKDGVDMDLTTSDPLVLKTVRYHMKGKGPEDQLFGVTRGRADAYLKRAVPGFKLKDLRTAFGSGIAAALVQRMPVPKDLKEFKRQRLEVAKAVSAQLGNTPSVALSAYINPVVFAKWDAALSKLAA